MRTNLFERPNQESGRGFRPAAPSWASGAADGENGTGGAASSTKPAVDLNRGQFSAYMTPNDRGILMFAVRYHDLIRTTATRDDGATAFGLSPAAPTPRGCKAATMPIYAYLCAEGRLYGIYGPLQTL